MKMSADIDQFSYDKQFAMLTQLYLELSLSVRDALRAAEADLYSPEDLEMVSQSCHWTFQPALNDRRLNLSGSKSNGTPTATAGEDASLGKSRH
jgi:hypothetical protein